MKDPFLNYFALGLLFFVVIVLVYGIIAIHDIPARIAKARHHPHEDAIHAAGWVSLVMLHVLWPFLWIWAMAYKPDRGWGFSQRPGEPSSSTEAVADLERLKHRLATIETKLDDRLAAFSEGGGRLARAPEPSAASSAAASIEKQTGLARDPTPAETRVTKR